MTQALTKEWYVEIEKQAAQNFINLPLDFQLRGYDYEYISDSYFTFFDNEYNTRQDKLVLAKKFLKFLRNLNRNRAKEECGPNFFKCYDYFLNNFSDLMSKNDIIALNALDLMQEAIDRASFVEDAVSLDVLKNRIEKVQAVKEREEIIDAEWTEFAREYERTHLLSLPEVEKDE